MREDSVLSGYGVGDHVDCVFGFLEFGFEVFERGECGFEDG